MRRRKLTRPDVEVRPKTALAHTDMPMLSDPLDPCIVVSCDGCGHLSVCLTCKDLISGR